LRALDWYPFLIQNRQPFALNDVRNSRGVLQAIVVGAKILNWQVSGVDVRKLADPYNSSGFTDEMKPLHPLELNSEGTIIYLGLALGRPTWNELSFDVDRESEATLFVPLRLRLFGNATCYVFLNNVLVARYYGNGDGPQRDFLLQDGLLQEKNLLRFLSYGHAAKASTVVEIKPWLGCGSLGSGNVDDTGHAFRLFKKSIRFR
jgi:hypothetical protein